MSNQSINRRQLLRFGLQGAALIPLLNLTTPLRAQSDLPRVEENSPQAAALGYKHNADNVDFKRFPARGKESTSNQFCHNCSLYLSTNDDEWGPCQIFPGKSVHRDGWCSVWSPAG